MLIGQWREYFFLILLCEEGKIICSRLVVRLPNNIEGKITECWLVNEESIFS